MAEGALSTALSNISTVISSVVGIISGNTILMTMFAGGLIIVGAKVFKKLKKASAS